MENQEKSEITTIKLSRETKARLDKLKNYKRETYEELLQNILNLLNTVKINPEKARSKLLVLDRIHRKASREKTIPNTIQRPQKPTYRLS